MRPHLSPSLTFKLTIVLLFCGALIWSLRHRPGSKIDPERVEMIMPGMTVEEVTAIIGDPPGDYFTLTEDKLDYHTPKAGELRWANDDYAIWVTLDAGGKVAETYHVQSFDRFVRKFQERSFWWRVRDWLGW
ncbi:MAG: hypothetical protein QM703_13765 [Gemmatales bacterium]